MTTITRPMPTRPALPSPPSLVLATLLLVALALPGCGKRQLTEDQAVDLLHQRVLADKLYPASRQGECLSFEVEQRLDTRYEIAVREKHGQGCPGDPGTGPVLDRFEVQQGDGRIRRYDPIAGSYVDYAPEPGSPGG